MDHRLDSLIGLLALHEPLSHSDEELRSSGQRYLSVFGPQIELPEGFSSSVRRMMERYISVGMRPDPR